jgi:hypothetical protein
MGVRSGMGLMVMNKKVSTPPYFPQLDDTSTEDDLIKKMRARRLAEMLSQQASAPIDYDPRGAISSSQLMAKALAGAGSMFANQQQDREQARSMIEQNRQEQEMFSTDGGFGGNPLAGNMTGEQARYLRATNPEKWAEMVADRQKYTNEMRNAEAAWNQNAGDYMQQDQMADLRKKQGDASLAGLKDVAPEHTLYDGQSNRPLFTANKLYEQDFGDRRNITAVNAGTGQSNVIRSDSVGVDPTTKYRIDNAPSFGGSGKGAEMSDQDALTHALGIRDYGDGYKVQMFGRSTPNPKVSSMYARLARGETPEQISEGFDAGAVNKNQGAAFDSGTDADSRRKAVLKTLDPNGFFGKTADSLGTIGMHADTLKKAYLAYNNGNPSPEGIKILNQIGMAYETQIGDDKLASLLALKTKIVPEMARVAQAGGITALADREKMEKVLDPANPAFMSALSSMEDAIGERMYSHKLNYARSTKRDDYDSLFANNAHSKAMIEKAEKTYTLKPKSANGAEAETYEQRAKRLLGQ